MATVGGLTYDQAMVIDGNDERGIDVGVLLRGGCRLDWMRSHVDDRDEQGLVFSRDCAEYAVRTASGARFVLLVNHLKSKGYGSPAATAGKRRRQALRIRAIDEELLQVGETRVAVVGDFNDQPDAAALAPLLRESDLRDVSAHPSFEDGGRPGTHGNCTQRDKIDYLLLSPALFERVRSARIDRSGVWGGTRGTLFPHRREIRSAAEAASDHAALWADLEL